MSFLHKNIANLYIASELDTWSKNLNTDFALGSCLFWAFNLTKTADPDKYGYSGYGIGFNAHSQCTWYYGSWGWNVIIFYANMSSFVHVDHKNQNGLVLQEGPVQGLDDTTLTAEAKYLNGFTQSGIIMKTIVFYMLIQ